jgi:hypothetical protein
MLRRFPAFCVLLALPALSAAGCADPGVGGSGELVRAAGGGAGDHLTLAGTPYEMGWWHGHLLKDRIRALHEEWQKQAFALDGDLLSSATKERRAAALALVDPVLQKHLPEEVRREYEGLAAGCGLPVRTLLLTEMLTDILRFTEKAPRLLTGRDVRRRPDEGVLLALDGPWQNLLAPHWTWITRKPTSGTRGTTVLTWPGSLGASLAARADGLVALEREEAMEAGRESLAAAPFRVSLRRALERSDDPAALLGALARTTAHQVLAVDLAKDVGLRQRIAMAGEEPTDAPAPPPMDPSDSMSGLAALHRELVCATGCFGARRRDEATWVTWQTGATPERSLRVP